MEHVCIPVPNACPPAPKKNHIVRLKGDGNWEHVSVEDFTEMPSPPAPKKGYTEIYTGNRWLVIKKRKI